MSEHRDRAMRIELKNVSKPELLAALDGFVESQEKGRIGFEKVGEAKHNGPSYVCKQ